MSIYNRNLDIDEKFNDYANFCAQLFIKIEN